MQQYIRVLGRVSQVSRQPTGGSIDGNTAVTFGTPIDAVDGAFAVSDRTPHTMVLGRGQWCPTIGGFLDATR